MSDTALDVPVWRNWSGSQVVRHGTLRHVRSEAEIAAVVLQAAADESVIRTAGAGHSHQPLVPTDDTILDVSALSGVLGTAADSATGTATATVWAGTPIYALGRTLLDAGLALHNQGDIDRQFIAGAVATGTHGTGRSLGNLSSAVRGATVVLASGDVVDCSAEREPELFSVLRHHLGAVGVVTRLTLDVRPAYRLAEAGTRTSYDDLRPRLETLAREHRHFEFFWYPTSDLAVAKTIDETTAEPVYPLGGEGTRTGWSHEVLPNHRTWPHTEMEYSVAADDGPACLDAIRDMLRRRHPEMGWPVEYRTLAADDVLLSTANERPTITISLHQGVEVDDEPMFRDAEEIFRHFDGRPHWGKVNYLSGDDLAEVHPGWDRWWSQRDLVDPSGMFCNDYLQSIRPR